MDVEQAKLASEASLGLDELIERRGRERSEAESSASGAREALWQASVERYLARRREENRAAWRAYHLELADNLKRTAAVLAAEHRAKAGLLEELEEGSDASRS